MADIRNVKGDIQGPKPEDHKKKKGVESEAFKKMMKVDKTDPEEKKKRKRQEEIESEEQADARAGAPSQGLPSKTAEPSPFEVTGGKEPVTGAEKAAAALPPSEIPPQYYSPTEKPEEMEKPTAPGEKAPVEHKKRKKGVSHVEKKKKVAKKAPVKGEKGAPIAKPTKAKETAKPALPKIEKPEKKEAPEAPVEGAQPLPEGAWEATKAPEKEEKKEGPLEEIAGAIPKEAMPVPPGTPLEAAPPLAAPFAHLPPHVQQLFDRMIGVMTVMHESGMTETTINLNNPQFAQSPFFGAQVIITEFSTAPKEFNIELLGTQKAATLFQDNSEDLLAAFKAGDYNFKVNRVDTGILAAERAEEKKGAKRVRRKKSSGGT